MSALGEQNSSHAGQVKKINNVRVLGDASREENSGIARKTFLSGGFVPQAGGLRRCSVECALRGEAELPVVSLTFFRPLPLGLLRLLLSLLLWLLWGRLALRPLFLDLRLRRRLLTLGRPLRRLPLLTLDLRAPLLRRRRRDWR